jgi:hypothetical protein
MSLASVSKIEWDIAFNVLSEEQRSRVYELALRVMPSEPPEPGDVDENENYGSFTFATAKEIADYFGIAE